MNTYETSDMYEASLLYTLGFEIESHYRDGKRVIFSFSPGQECKEKIRRYYNNDIKVNPRVFGNSINTIKHLAYSMR